MQYLDIIMQCRLDDTLWLKYDQPWWYKHYRTKYRSAIKYYASWDYHRFVARAENRLNTATTSQARAIICVQYDYDVQLRNLLPEVDTQQLYIYSLAYPYPHTCDLLYHPIDVLAVRRIHPVIYKHLGLCSTYRSALMSDNPTLPIVTFYANHTDMIEMTHHVIGSDLLNIFNYLHPLLRVQEYVIALGYRAVRICKLFTSLVITVHDIQAMLNTYDEIQADIPGELDMLAYHLAPHLDTDAVMALIKYPHKLCYWLYNYSAHRLSLTQVLAMLHHVEYKWAQVILNNPRLMAAVKHSDEVYTLPYIQDKLR